MSHTFYAKTDQTYKEHIEAAYGAWVETTIAMRPFLEKISKLLGFSLDRFLKGTLLAVALHDIGKMSAPFQEMICAKQVGDKFDYKNNYRHELISFVYLVHAWSALRNNKDLMDKVPIEPLAVAAHHKDLNSDMTSFEREGAARWEKSPPKVFADGIHDAFEIAHELFIRQEWQFPENPLRHKGLNIDDPYGVLAGLVGNENGLCSLVNRSELDDVRTIYAITKGILHYADWYGSGNAHVNYQTSVAPFAILASLKERCEKRGIKFEGLRVFQEECASCSGHVIAVAPTGSGKTEASILWALKNLEEMGGAKIIYLLPTMATANSIWLRLVELFGAGNVGLTHSSANLLLESAVEEGEADLWENRLNYLFDKTFMYPVTVATVDQLLTVGFNSGHWTVKELNAANAVIIMDEIHAYDGWTLGLIIKSIEHYTKLGARFFVTSATLSGQFIDLLKETLGTNSNVIKDQTLLAKSRSKYFVKDKDIFDAVSEIRASYLNGNRTLVVVNTVERCQMLTEALTDLGPICYHSRFIFRDRKEIERKIESARLVIATQVVEVSLDIDYDWLFTECAPPDAIVQRCGRVNRYRDPMRDSRVFIYRTSKDARRIYDDPIIDPTLTDRSYDVFSSFIKKQSELTEEDLIDVVETVYKGYSVQQTEAYQDASVAYSNCQVARLGIFDNRKHENKQEVTRRSKYEQVSIVPSMFKSIVFDLKPSERRLYEVKVPLWYLMQPERKEEEKGIVFCNISYDEILGAKLDTENNSRISTICF